jgi:hypothetical protein
VATSADGSQPVLCLRVRLVSLLQGTAPRQTDFKVASGEKQNEFVVARDRIELPTRGFSVLDLLNSGAPRST